MNKLNVHIISHTHWDREWFLPAIYTSPWLVSFFDKLFSLLSTHKDYKFILDGQVQIIEDYLGELEEEEREEKEGLLKRYIKEGRLFIGPYWAQIDWQIPGPESLVRNLLLADRYIKRYGKKMNIGWLPDTFGQIGQAPQIHLLSKIDGVFVWRGVEFPKDDVRSEFLWEGPDGSLITSVYFLASYRNLMGLTTYPEIANPRLQNEAEKIRPFLATENALLMNGYDLDNAPEYPLSVIERDLFPDYEIFHSDPGEYVKDIKKASPSLLTLKGELLSGRYLSVFPGKLSTRAYLKVENYMCENFLSRVLEPIGVFSWLLSGYYPLKEINSLWKELILNEIHDNISGVGVDQIHKRMEESYANIMKKGKDLLYTILSYTIPSLGEGRWIVFNTNPFSVDTSFEKDGRLCVIKDVPPLGFKVLSDISSYPVEIKDDKIENFIHENDYYRAIVSEDGTLALYDKKSRRTFKNIGFFLDEEDSGDEYNFSPGDPEKSVTTQGKRADITLIKTTPISSTIKVKHRIASPSKEEILLVYSITFDDTPLIKYRIHIENSKKNHRLKMIFPTSMEKPDIVSHMPFEYVKRSEFIDNSLPIPQRFSRIFIGARECGRDYEFPMGDFVALSDSSGSFAIFPKGLKEYEVHGSDIHITLFRSVGWISNPDIKTRTGDAGPLMYTPSAQCIGEFNVELSLYVSNKNPEDRNFRYWKGLYHNPPVVVYAEGKRGGKLKTYSLFETEDVEITGVKVAEDGDGVIIRGFNPLKRAVTLNVPFSCAKRVDLLENTLDEIDDSIELSPMEIFTLKIPENPGTQINPFSGFSLIHPDFEWNIYKQREGDLRDKKDIEFLEKTRDRLLNEIKALEEELPKKKGLLYHRTLFHILSRKRTYLEVVLSLILNEEAFTLSCEKKEELKEKIREIGFKLNTARIERRAYEYVLDYYENLDNT